jgi:dolichol-phosphate mannosyltransferase
VSFISVSVVMPAFNEEDGIAAFLKELRSAFRDVEATFIVVDDCSTDKTSAEVTRLALEGFPVSIMRNQHNSGHGISTRRALEAGLSSGSEYVIAIDGDGQFEGVDVRRVFDQLTGSLDVIEGVRRGRQDPWFRRLVTFSTRCLVFFRSGHFPKDANTPLRAYRRERLKEILSSISPSTPVPNLEISALVRRGNFAFLELDVRSRDRLGSEVIGSSWGRGVPWLPTKRFLKFVRDATKSWFSSPE